MLSKCIECSFFCVLAKIDFINIRVVYPVFRCIHTSKLRDNRVRRNTNPDSYRDLCSQTTLLKCNFLFTSFSSFFLLAVLLQPMKSFDVPIVYRSPLISTIKKKRKEEDKMKRDFSPTVLDFGPLKIYLARH